VRKIGESWDCVELQEPVKEAVSAEYISRMWGKETPSVFVVKFRIDVDIHDIIAFTVPQNLLTIG